MTTYVLEMRSTANWSDVRYREYTTSEKKAEIFRGVPKIQFTDSGHGIVPAVREHVRGPREPRNMMLADHVQDYIAAEGRKVKPARKAHKVMTPAEYAAMPIIGWHEVCRDVDGFGGVGVRFIGVVGGVKDGV